MLTAFPDLLTYGILVPTALRVIVGIIFLGFAYKTYTQKDKVLSAIEHAGFRPRPLFWYKLVAVEFLGGALLVVGLFVQVVALILALLMGAAFFIALKKRDVFQNKSEFFLLITFVLLSLMILGPGLWAIDLPL